MKIVNRSSIKNMTTPFIFQLCATLKLVLRLIKIILWRWCLNNEILCKNMLKYHRIDIWHHKLNSCSLFWVYIIEKRTYIMNHYHLSVKLTPYLLCFIIFFCFRWLINVFRYCFPWVFDKGCENSKVRHE